MAKARSIIEENDVSIEIDGYASKHTRFTDVWDSWKWRLSRDPKTEANCVHDTENVMMIKSDPAISHYGVPLVTILYRFTDNEVIILAIKINGATD